MIRALCVLALCTFPSLAATFGTVVAHAQPVSDLVIDEARRRLYVVNTASSQVEVYSTTTNPPRLTNTIKTDTTPLAAAIARNGRALYVACYGSSSLYVVDLTSTNFAARSVTLPASPQGVAVGFNEKVLITTIGTGTGQSVLLTYDPTTLATLALQSIPVAPPASATPALPPPNGQFALAARGILRASLDGRTIIGMHNLANNTKTVFVFDVNSATVLGSRNLGPVSPVLAVAPDGSRFLAGSILFETSTLLVQAQQNVLNAPYVFPAVANFTLQTTQGGAVFAQVGGTAVLLAAYNIVPTLVPAARANSSQLLVNSPANLLVRQGIQLPENLSGKMVVTSDSATAYAISQSGFIVLPIGALAQSPLAVPDSNFALLSNDQCGATANENSAVIPVRNIGGGRLTVTAQVLATSATSATVRSTARPYGGDVTAQFSAAAARTLGTAAPDTLLVQAAEAVNIIPNIRVYQNNRNTESRGKIVPVDIGPTLTGLTDMAADAPRQRLYIANPSLNRVEVFDMRAQQFLAPIEVGQLPRSLVIGGDGNTLYVANAGGESISVIDLNERAVTGRVNFPPVPFNAAFALITPQVLAGSQRGPHVLMSDGTLWKIVGNAVAPRTLNTNIFGNVRAIAGPQSMTASPDGSFALIVAGNGNGYLYEAGLDDFISTRLVAAAPITGYYGPIAAGPGGQFYLFNDQVLNQALTPIGSAPGTGPVGGGGLPSPGGPVAVGRPVAAVAAVNPQTYARFSTAPRANATAAPTDAGLVEVIDLATQRTIATATALEGPPTAVIGNVRVNIPGRALALDAAGANAYVITTSGLSVIPLAPVSTQNAPQLAASPVVNIANFTTAIAPGGLIAVLGRNLAATATSGGANLPTVLGGACVTLNNVPIPLLATSAGQINAQIPFTLAPGRYPIVVRSAGGASGTANVTVARYAPAVFLDEEGAAIFHKDGRRVTLQNPARRDEQITIYATGLGVTTGGRVTTGQPAPSNPLAVTAPVNLYFGPPTYKEAPIIVEWSGLQPGKIGVYQINARVPGPHINGDALPVTIRIGGVDSPRSGLGAAYVTVK